MPAGEPPPPGTRHGHDRPPDDPSEEEGWTISRHVQRLFGWPSVQTAPALPPLTASGLRAQQDQEHEDGAVQRPLEIIPDAVLASNVVAQLIRPQTSAGAGSDPFEESPQRSGVDEAPTRPVKAQSGGAVDAQSPTASEPLQGTESDAGAPAGVPKQLLTPAATVYDNYLHASLHASSRTYRTPSLPEGADQTDPNSDPGGLPLTVSDPPVLTGASVEDSPAHTPSGQSTKGADLSVPCAHSPEWQRQEGKPSVGSVGGHQSVAAPQQCGGGWPNPQESPTEKGGYVVSPLSQAPVLEGQSDPSSGGSDAAGATAIPFPHPNQPPNPEHLPASSVPISATRFHPPSDPPKCLGQNTVRGLPGASRAAEQVSLSGGLPLSVEGASAGQQEGAAGTGKVVANLPPGASPVQPTNSLPGVRYPQSAAGIPDSVVPLNISQFSGDGDPGPGLASTERRPVTPRQNPAVSAPLGKINRSMTDDRVVSPGGHNIMTPHNMARPVGPIEGPTIPIFSSIDSGLAGGSRVQARFGQPRDSATADNITAAGGSTKVKVSTEVTQSAAILASTEVNQLKSLESTEVTQSDSASGSDTLLPPSPPDDVQINARALSSGGLADTLSSTLYEAEFHTVRGASTPSENSDDFERAVDDGMTPSGHNKPVVPTPSAMVIDRRRTRRLRAAVAHWRLAGACNSAMDKVWHRFHSTLCAPPAGVYERNRDVLINELSLCFLNANSTAFKKSLACSWSTVAPSRSSEGTSLLVASMTDPQVCRDIWAKHSHGPVSDADASVAASMSYPFNSMIPPALFLQSIAHAVVLHFWQRTSHGLFNGRGLYSSNDGFNSVTMGEGVAVILHSGEANGEGAKIIPSASGEAVWPAPAPLRGGLHSVAGVSPPGNTAEVASQYVLDHLSVSYSPGDYDFRVIHSLVTSALLSSHGNMSMNLGQLPLSQSLTYNDTFSLPIHEVHGAVEQTSGYSRRRILLVHITPQAISAASLSIESQQYANLAKFPPVSADTVSAGLYDFSSVAMREHFQRSPMLKSCPSEPAWLEQLGDTQYGHGAKSLLSPGDVLHQLTHEWDPGFASVVHSVLLRSYESASAVMTEAAVPAHFAPERPESFLLGILPRRCGVCSTEFHGFHCGDDDDYCQCCRHSLAVAQCPPAALTLSAAKVCVEWAAGTISKVESVHMIRVMAARNAFNKGGVDAAEFVQACKDLADRLEQLNKARVPLANILGVLLPTTSPYDSSAVENQALHEALSTVNGENELFQALKDTDPRFADIKEWITAEVAYSVSLIAYQLEEDDPQQNFQAPQSLCEASNFELRQPTSERIRSRAATEQEAAFKSSVQQLQQQRLAIQQDQLRVKNLEERLEAAVAAVAAAAASHKTAHQEQLDLAKMARAEAAADAKAAALFLNKALKGDTGPPSSSPRSSLGDVSPVPRAQGPAVPSPEDMDVIDEHFDGDATSEDDDGGEDVMSDSDDDKSSADDDASPDEAAAPASVTADLRSLGCPPATDSSTSTPGRDSGSGSKKAGKEKPTASVKKPEPAPPPCDDEADSDDGGSSSSEDSSNGEEYSSDEPIASRGGSAVMAEVILVIMNPDNGDVYTPSNSTASPSMLKALERVTVDTQSCETILQGMVKPLGKALNFTAAQRNATVANTSQCGIQVDTPWRILKSSDPSVCSMVFYAYAPDPADTEERREKLPILNDYSPLPVSIKKKRGHLHVGKSCGNVISTLAAMSHTHAVIKEYQQQSSGRLIFILHSETSSKRLGDCKFHMLSPSLENEELSFLSVTMKGKAYQRLAKSKVAATSRSLLKHFYDDDEDFSVDTTKRGSPCFIRKGTDYYVYVTANNPPTDLIKRASKIDKACVNTFVDLSLGHEFEEVSWDPNSWPLERVDQLTRSIVFCEHTVNKLGLGNSQVNDQMLPLWRSISHSYLLSDEPRALSSRRGYKSPEIHQLTELYGDGPNGGLNDSISLSRSRTLSPDPRAPSSPRNDGGLALAECINKHLSFVDNIGPFAEHGHLGGLEFSSESSSSDGSQVLYIAGHPDGNSCLDSVINHQLRNELIDGDRLREAVTRYGPLSEMVSTEAQQLCRQALFLEMTDVITHFNVQFLNHSGDDHAESRQDLADLGLVMGPSSLHGQGVHSLVSHEGHDSHGVMRPEIHSAVERSRRSTKAPTFPFGKDVEILTSDQLKNRYPDCKAEYVVQLPNGRYADFSKAQDVAWMRFNDSDSKPTHSVHVWDDKKTTENPTGLKFQILLIAATFSAGAEQTINYNEAARRRDTGGRYTHSSQSSATPSIERPLTSDRSFTHHGFRSDRSHNDKLVIEAEFKEEYELHASNLLDQKIGTGANEMRGLILAAFNDVSAKVRMHPDTALRYFERKILTSEVLIHLQEARQREGLRLDTPDEVVDWINLRWRPDASAHKRLIDKVKSSIDISPNLLSLDLDHMLLNYRHWDKLLNQHVPPAIIERDYSQKLFRSQVIRLLTKYDDLFAKQGRDFKDFDANNGNTTKVDGFNLVAILEQKARQIRGRAFDRDDPFSSLAVSTGGNFDARWLLEHAAMYCKERKDVWDGKGWILYPKSGKSESGNDSGSEKKETGRKKTRPEKNKERKEKRKTAAAAKVAAAAVAAAAPAAAAGNGQGGSGNGGIDWGNKNFRDATTTGNEAHDKARKKQHSELIGTQSSDTFTVTNSRNPSESISLSMSEVRNCYKDFDHGYKQCSPCFQIMFEVLNKGANNFVNVCVSCGRQIGFDDGQCKGPIRCPNASKMKDTGKSVTFEEYRKRNVGQAVDPPFYSNYGSHGDWTRADGKKAKFKPPQHKEKSDGGSDKNSDKKKNKKVKIAAVRTEASALKKQVAALLTKLKKHEAAAAADTLAEDVADDDSECSFDSADTLAEDVADDASECSFDSNYDSNAPPEPGAASVRMCVLALLSDIVTAANRADGHLIFEWVYSRNGHKLKVMADSGATHCIATRSAVQKSGDLKRLNKKDACNVGMANDSKVRCLGSIDNVHFTHEKVGHVIPKLYVVDKLFDNVDYLLGNNWMSESKVIVVPYQGVIMGVTPEQITFMMGLRKTEASATELFDTYCKNKPVKPVAASSGGEQTRKKQPSKEQPSKKKAAQNPRKGDKLPAAGTQGAVINRVYRCSKVDRLFTANSTLVGGGADGNRGADINREAKGTSKSQDTTPISKSGSSPNAATATSSSWSTIDSNDSPYYWVDPPASDEPVVSVARRPDDDDDDELEEEDPELEEDAIPPDRIAALNITTPEWILSILRKTVRSNRPFPREVVMAHDIQQDRIRPEPERRLSKAPHPWMFVLQDTMLYGYEAVYDGRKPTAKGALKFHTERKARRGDNEPRIGSKEIKQAYSSCFGEGGLFHRYRADLYEDIRRCKRQTTPKESEQSQQEDLCTDSVQKLRKRHERRNLKATPIVINGQVVSTDAIWHTEDEATLVTADQVEGIQGVDPKVIARLKLDNHKIENVHGCMSSPGVYLASLKKRYNARTKHWESAGYQVVYDDQFFRHQEQIAELKSASIAELTAASHDPQKYLAVAARLVKEEYGDDAVLDGVAAKSCAVRINRAQPQLYAAKANQAERRLEAVQEEQDDNAPAGRGVFEVLPPGELKIPPRPKEVTHPDYTIVPPGPDADANGYANQEFLAQTDVTWKGYANSVGREVDGSEFYEAQAATTCINDKPKMNWSDEEIEKFGVRIKLKPGCVAPKPESRRIGHALLPVVAEMLKELLEAGIIERGTSYTSCPAFLVKKPAYIGKTPAELKDIPNHKLWRLVLDFRALNRVTEPNSYPTPNVADTVRSLREITLRSHEYDQKRNIKSDWEGATPQDPKGSLSSSLDWSSAFFTQPTHYSSKKLTCFVIPGLGSFLFRGAPMGQQSIPSNFVAYARNRLEKHGVIYEAGLTDLQHQRLEQIRGLDGKMYDAPTGVATVYIDDSLIQSASYHHQYLALTAFYRACAAENLWCNSKGKLGCKRVSFVGYSIGYDGMCSSPGKVEAINAMKDKFENKGEIRTFMGKIQFFGQWIKDLGELAAPLYANLKDDVPEKFTEKEWTPECTESVRLLKERLCQYPILRMPDPTKPFYLLTDASRKSGAACLAQADENGKLYVVEYCSKVWNFTQRRYSVSELELLIIIVACRKWSVYLRGNTFVTRCYSDHQANIALVKKKEISSPRLATWHAVLSEYNIVLEWKPGHDPKLAVSDALSRLLKAPVDPSAGIPHSGIKPSPSHGSDYDDDEEWTYSHCITEMYDFLFDRLKHRSTHPAAAASASVTFEPSECPSSAYDDEEPVHRAYSYDIAEEELDDEPDNIVGRCACAAPIWCPIQTDNPTAASVAVEGLCHARDVCDEIVGEYTNIHDDDLYCSGYMSAVSAPSGCPLVDDGLTDKVLAKCVSSQTPKDYQEATWTRKIYALLDPKRDTAAQKVAQSNQPAYERHKDALYYKVEDALNPLRLCVPRRTSQRYLCYYYHMRNNSHSAPSAMSAAIKKHYWWPTIAADCKALYDHCHICKRTKHRSAKPYGNLQRMAPPMESGVSYGIDFLTALPPSGVERYTWCMTVKDHFSGYTHLLPCSEHITADQAVSLFDREICKRSCKGQPLIIKCDRDARFTKAAFSQAMKLGGTHVRFGTAHRSDSNGAVERANQAISVLLRGFRVQQHFWASLIPYVMWLLNTRPQMHLGGLSAAEIESGRTPLDALYMTEPILSQRQVPADVGEILERHRFLRQLVDDHRRYAWDLMADQFNQHHQYYDRAELPPGSYAYVLAKHLTSDEQRAGLADAAKLRDRYWGPYKVLKWVNSADVELEIPKSNTGAHNVFHISRIKKAADTAAEAKKLSLPRWMRKGFPSKLTVEDKDYEISGIVGHHDYAADGEKEYKREYLVRYRGYDPEDSLWHTDEHLKTQAPKLLKKYLKSIEGQMTYMQNDQRVVSKDDNKNKTKTKDQAAAKSRRPT